MNSLEILQRHFSSYEAFSASRPAAAAAIVAVQQQQQGPLSPSPHVTNRDNIVVAAAAALHHHGGSLAKAALVEEGCFPVFHHRRHHRPSVIDESSSSEDASAMSFDGGMKESEGAKGASRGKKGRHSAAGRTSGAISTSSLFGARTVRAGALAPKAVLADGHGSSMFGKRPGRPKGSKGNSVRKRGTAATTTQGGGEVLSSCRDRVATPGPGQTAHHQQRSTASTSTATRGLKKDLSMPIVCDNTGELFIAEDDNFQDEIDLPTPRQRTSSAVPKRSKSQTSSLPDTAKQVQSWTTSSTAVTSTTLLTHSKPKLAYSSATNKPVCLCIIWVHLQATVTSEGGIDQGQQQQHHCIMKKAPEPVSEGHKLTCHYCRCGYSSYASYLDHLHSSQCGHKQRSNNKPQVPTAEVLPLLNLKDPTHSAKGRQDEDDSSDSQDASKKDGKGSPEGASALTAASSSFDNGSTTLKDRHDSSLAVLTDANARNQSYAGTSISSSCISPMSNLSARSTSVSSTSSGKKRKLNKLPNADWRQEMQQGQQQQQQHQMQQQQHLLQAGITKPYFQHHIHSQQQHYRHPYQHQHQMMLQQHAQQKMRQQQMWQQQQQSRFYSPYVAPYQQTYPMPGHPMYGNPLPTSPTAGWQHWNNSMPLHPPPPYYGQHIPHQQEMTSPVYNQTYYGQAWDHSANFTPGGQNQHWLSQQQQQYTQPLSHLPSHQQPWQQRPLQQYDMGQPHQQQQPQHHMNQVQISPQMPRAQNSYYTPQNHSYNSRNHIGQSHYEDELYHQQQQQQQLVQRQDASSILLQTSEDLEPPPRPSSDEDVIRAAAEVVARDNGTLPVLAHDFQTLTDGSDNVIVSNEELFDDSNSGNSVVISGDFTSDEAVTLAGLNSITSLNSLVNFVSEACYDDIGRPKQHRRQERPMNSLGSSGGGGGSGGSCGMSAASSQSPHSSVNNASAASSTSAAFNVNSSPVSSTTETAHSEDIPDNGESQDGYLPESFLKEGSQDPVLTATAQIAIPKSVAMMQGGSGANHHHHHQGSHGGLRPPAADLEVVIVDKAMEFDGPEETITLHYSLQSSNDIQNSSLLSDDEEKGSSSCSASSPASSGSKKPAYQLGGDHSQCPHRAVVDLPKVAVAEQIKDHLTLVTMQAQLGYVLLGLLGEKRLTTFGYPHRSVISILHTVLELTKTNLVEETYNCTNDCKNLEHTIDQEQLSYRLVQRRIRVLRANIGKLLCICVPVRNKWKEFGWDGKSVEDILEELSKADIPTCHPGDPEYKDPTPQGEEEEQEELVQSLEDFEKIPPDHGESVVMSVCEGVEEVVVEEVAAEVVMQTKSEESGGSADDVIDAEMDENVDDAVQEEQKAENVDS